MMIVEFSPWHMDSMANNITKNTKYRQKVVVLDSMRTETGRDSFLVIVSEYGTAAALI